MTNQKMDPLVKSKWVAALRSGKYTQGRYSLATVGADGEIAYCCLGVLCDLAVKDGVISEKSVTASGRYLQYLGESNVLPEYVRTWAGLDNLNPAVACIPSAGRETRHLYLAELNDGTASIDPRSFAEIADLIEEQL
jgi:hypothetical protein